MTHTKWVPLDLSLRDHFASIALQAYLANLEYLVSPNKSEPSADVVAHLSYSMADAMLKHRELSAIVGQKEFDKNEK